VKKSTLTIADIKELYHIDDAWRDLLFDGAPGKCVSSPLREDKDPSFSVYDNGRRFNDFGTDQKGDVFTFVGLALNSDFSGARQWILERIGSASSSYQISQRNGSALAERKQLFQKNRKPLRAELRFGSSEELATLNAQRGLGVDALKAAEAHGFLRFCTWFGHVAWCITDRRREIFEFRRLDGEWWLPWKNLHKRKSHCWGAHKDWPIGVLEAKEFKKCALVEGAPDFLALFHFLLAEGKEEEVAPLAILGGSNRIDAEAVKFLGGRHVRIFPHLDKNRQGEQAACNWARSLAKECWKIDAFDLSGCIRVDGKEGKDLADVCLIDPDCWEENPKFRHILP
jgi:hypothetical protein